MEAPEQLPGDVAALLASPAGWAQFCTAIGLHLTLEQLREQREAERAAAWVVERVSLPRPPQVKVTQVPLSVIRTGAGKRPERVSSTGLLRPVLVPELELPGTVIAEGMVGGGNRASRRRKRRVSPTP